ncbi:MAG: Gx transporter family protein [Clostridiaceae bacterium]|nr:Gx transporter family protein [Clostridiaceae bacterium]MDD5797214.1 Gx transporter family protein [Clostridiaceae bacterium]MDY4545952.1 Gx transporter family protein [Candidatus Choladocola sp.]
MQNKTKRLAFMGLLTALGLIIGYIEFLIPIPLGIPGVKPGFANIVIVWALYSLGPWEALMINGMRIFLSGFLFGNFSMILYSLAGAAVSFLCMCLAKKSGLFSMTGVSMIGGVMHNMGQLLVAMAVLETVSLVYYGPVLLAAGVITGLLIGIVTGEVKKRLPAVLVKKIES